MSGEDTARSALLRYYHSEVTSHSALILTFVVAIIGLNGYEQISTTLLSIEKTFNAILFFFLPYGFLKFSATFFLLCMSFNVFGRLLWWGFLTTAIIEVEIEGKTESNLFKQLQEKSVSWVKSPERRPLIKFSSIFSTNRIKEILSIWTLISISFLIGYNVFKLNYY